MVENTVAEAGTDADVDDDGIGDAGLEDLADDGAIVAVEDLPVARVELPVVPPIRLPDLSVLSETGSFVEAGLGGLAVADGLEVLGATCAVGTDELVYQGDEANSFLALETVEGRYLRDDSGTNDVEFQVNEDGSGRLRDLSQTTDLDIEVNGDGSGRFRDLSDTTDLDIVVNVDGSGRFRDLSDTTDLDIVVNADGTGRFRDLSDTTDLDIQINSDGSGRLRDLSNTTDLDIEVNADGTGRFRDLSQTNDVDIDFAGSDSWTFRDLSQTNDVDLTVNSDGSGQLRDLSATNDLEIVVDADGNGTYTDWAKDVSVIFRTEIGILDPNLIVAGPLPVFGVADRFPPLDRLAPLSPPCATVLRFNADVLFDFDSDQLRPEAGPVVDQLASALIETASPIEIHGHTDAIGDDAYNQDLAARRAQAFETALQERGVGVEIETLSFGETRPVAPNTNADGSDNPPGRQLNRRIEVVIRES